MLSELDSVTFTESEAEFLLQNRLARVATASASGQPHVVPVVYEFDGQSFYFSGWNLEKSLKFKNIMKNGRVAMVFDDLESVSPWRPRGIEVRGRAEIVKDGDRLCVKVVPSRKVSWGFWRDE